MGPSPVCDGGDISDQWWGDGSVINDRSPDYKKKLSWISVISYTKVNSRHTEDL